MRFTLLVLMSTCACSTTRAPRHIRVSPEEHAATVSAMRSNKHARPLVVIVAANDGTETTDFLVPYSVLKRSGAADVVSVSTDSGPIILMPSLRVKADTTLALFDTRVPEGADYVIVPALHNPETPGVLAWIRAQHDKGAVIIGVCSGARVLANAGLLRDRRATGHWYDIDDLRDENPGMEWVRDRRYVVDRGVVTTTGVTASLPVSLALVEAIVGTSAATALAEQLGGATWDEAHDSDAFRSGRGYAWTVAWNTVAFWGHDTFVVDVTEGIDEPHSRSPLTRSVEPIAPLSKGAHPMDFPYAHAMV